MNEFINKYRIVFIVIIVVLTIVTGLYTTYSLGGSSDSGTSTEYDMSLSFDLSNSVSNSITVPAGSTKLFEIVVTNPYKDTVKYGVAHNLTSIPSGVTIAQVNNSKATASGNVNANSSKRVSIIVKNESASSTTVGFSVIGGYKNGGSLIIPSDKRLVTDVYTLVENLPDITFASFTVPSTKSFTVNPNCTGANVTYDYETQRYKISNISVNNGAVCSPVYTTKTKNYLNSHIISKVGTTQGTGQVVNENGYRYEGKNPNNYIKFNNELWRIIGVFDESSHGQTGQNLTKIIRNDSIGGFAWDKNNVNIWPQSSLYNLLNTYYYNATDGTNSGYCYTYSTTLTGNCDYRSGGINDYYRPMVKNVTWYLGGYSSTRATADSFYTYERSSDDTYYYTNNRTNKTTTGHIGLMYASDYGYSVLASSCARTTNLSSYSTSACGGSSWLSGMSYEWTITHSPSYGSYVFCVINDGNLYYNHAYSGYASRPVLYLDSSVYILDGDGSKGNPYVISMDS